MLVAKFISSSNNEDQEAPWLQNPWRKDATDSTKEYDELGQILSPVTICMHNQFALSCITLHRVTSLCITFDST